MSTPLAISRRTFIALSGGIPLALSAQVNSSAPAAPAGPAVSPAVSTASAKKVPLGLEMYSVRAAMMRDLPGTVTAVGKMGYEIVEFYAPYFDWSFPQAKEIRKLMDDLSIRSNSTHNSAGFFSAQNLPKAIELNQILGTKYLVMASAPRASNTEGWKAVAATLTAAAEALKPHGLYTGYHNHAAEWVVMADGKRPMDVLAENTPKEVMLQLDVGTCVEAGADPVAWIKANPGRINSVHLKEWGKAQGYRSLFSEGDSPWKDIFTAAENGGGVEYYLIEQEQAPGGVNELQAVERDLAAYKKMRE